MVTIGLSRTSDSSSRLDYVRVISTPIIIIIISEINGDIGRKSHENRQFSHPQCI